MLKVCGAAPTLCVIEYFNDTDSYGTGYWYLNDTLHRLDGMAIKYSNGTGHWYIEGKILTEEEFQNDPRVLQTQAAK